jgi:hypothetical protein
MTLIPRAPPNLLAKSERHKIGTRRERASARQSRAHRRSSREMPAENVILPRALIALLPCTFVNTLCQKKWLR